MPQAPQNLRLFQSLVEVVQSLRGPEGCPWDKEQTHKSLSPFTLEEAHELAEALDHENLDEMKQELGDLLFQVLLHSEVARQADNFDVFDVIEELNKKMIRRHPHVFSDTEVKDSSEVIDNWNQIKAQEKFSKKRPPGFGIPVNLPALQRSQKIGGKTKKFNFDWNETSQVMEKVEEELLELKAAINSGPSAAIEHELGDLLFSIAQLARHLNIDSEQALRICNQRFENRFAKMQDLAHSQNLEFDNLDSSQLESLWSQAKALERD